MKSAVCLNLFFIKFVDIPFVVPGKKFDENATKTVSSKKSLKQTSIQNFKVLLKLKQVKVSKLVLITAELSIRLLKI